MSQAIAAAVFHPAPPKVNALMATVEVAVNFPPPTVTFVPLGPLVGLMLNSLAVTVKYAIAVDIFGSVPNEQIIAVRPGVAFVGMVAVSVKAPVPSVSTAPSPITA